MTKRFGPEGAAVGIGALLAKPCGDAPRRPQIAPQGAEAPGEVAKTIRQTGKGQAASRLHRRLVIEGREYLYAPDQGIACRRVAQGSQEIGEVRRRNARQGV